MKRNRNWQWIGRALLCALLICALLATAAVAEDGGIPAQGNVDIDSGDGINLDDGAMAELEGGSLPLDLSSLLPDLDLGIPGASDSGIDGLALESDGSADAIANSKSDDDALRQKEHQVLHPGPAVGRERRLFQLEQGRGCNDKVMII